MTDDDKQPWEAREPATPSSADRFGDDMAPIVLGRDSELALSGQKKSKGGRTPDQLLEDATDGDAEAERLWAEYARATWGRRQLGTSTNPGFRMLRVPSTDGEGFLRRGDGRFRGWDG